MLADHRPQKSLGIGSFILCRHADGTTCGEFDSWIDWSHHTAPIIAERIACDPERAIAALLTEPNPLCDMAEADERIATQLTAASDLFPQHQRK